MNLRTLKMEKLRSSEKLNNLLSGTSLLPKDLAFKLFSLFREQGARKDI